MSSNVAFTFPVTAVDDDFDGTLAASTADVEWKMERKSKMVIRIKDLSDAIVTGIEIVVWFGFGFGVI